MTKRIDVENEDAVEKLLKSSRLLFDTNVWLRVQGYFTDSRDRRSRAYSWFYRRALEQNAAIYLPQIVVSEYVKVSLVAMSKDAGRDEGKIHTQTGYQQWILDVSDDLSHVARDTVRLDDDFSKLNLDECLSHCQTNSIDFNDVLIARLCAEHSLTLVTDDADLHCCDIPIATANRKLLQA